MIKFSSKPIISSSAVSDNLTFRSVSEKEFEESIEQSKTSKNIGLIEEEKVIESYMTKNTKFDQKKYVKSNFNQEEKSQNKSGEMKDINFMPKSNLFDDKQFDDSKLGSRERKLILTNISGTSKSKKDTYIPDNINRKHTQSFGSKLENPKLSLTSSKRSETPSNHPCIIINPSETEIKVPKSPSSSSPHPMKTPRLFPPSKNQIESLLTFKRTALSEYKKLAHKYKSLHKVVKAIRDGHAKLLTQLTTLKDNKLRQMEVVIQQLQLEVTHLKQESAGVGEEIRGIKRVKRERIQERDVVEEVKKEVGRRILEMEERISKERRGYLERIVVLETKMDDVRRKTEVVKREKSKRIREGRSTHVSSNTDLTVKRDIKMLGDRVEVVRNEIVGRVEWLEQEFNECKGPLKQQIHRLVRENEGYERELIRYKHSLREFVDTKGHKVRRGFIN
jgi:hypothetical protein